MISSVTRKNKKISVAAKRSPSTFFVYSTMHQRYDRQQLMVGFLGAFTAYLIWGLQPIYWKTLSSVDAWIVIAHRYCWSCVFLIAFILCVRQWQELKETVHALISHPFNSFLLAIVSLIAVINWFINIFAPISGHVVELGIGLFLTPIMSVMLGVIFYKERLNRLQLISVVLAVIGVAIMLIRFGQFPWIALGVSSTWAVYGALKKKLYLKPSIAIFLESIIVLPGALLILAFADGESFFNMLSQNNMTAWALIGTGILTSLPLITYTYATNYLPLNILGFCQYISPILTLGLGVFVYKESFGLNELLPMLFVWVSIVLFFIGQRRGNHFRDKEVTVG